MRLPTLLTVAGLLAVAALGHSQVPPAPAPSPVGPPVPGVPFGQPAPSTPLAFPSPTPVSPPLPVPPASPHQLQSLLLTEPSSPVPPPEQTVDQLIEALERLKTLKAQIEKQEQAVKDALTKKLGEQNERLKKLGVGAKEEPAPVVPRTTKLKTSSDEGLAPAGGKEGVNPAALPKGVRELKLDAGRCKRSKVGPSISVFTSEQQAEAELGEVEGKATWKQIDPKTESLVVVGYPDTGLMLEYDLFEVREVKADAGSTYRFKQSDGNGKQRFTHLLLVEWAARCKVYAVPKGSAVALD